MPDRLHRPLLYLTLGSYLLLVDYTGRLFREGKAVIEQCGSYRSVAATHGLMQRGPPRRTTGDVNGRTGGEKDACHRFSRGVIEWRMPLWLLGIGIGPKANQLRRQLGLATRARLREAATALRVHHLANLDGCVAR